MNKRSFILLGVIQLLFLFIFTLSNVQAVAPIWSDSFDSYPTGTSLHGLGGWKGWFNDPIPTAFTTNVQAWNAPNSMAVASNTDLIHEYSVHSGLIHYRFHQYIPSNFQGTSYFIMLNQYDDGGSSLNWSAQVQHQSSTGLIIDDGTGASRPYLTNQWIEVCIEIDLDQDKQNYYYNGSLFYSGTWSDHISGGGITSFAAVSLYANSSTSVYYDGMILSTGDCSEKDAYYSGYLPIIIR